MNHSKKIALVAALISLGGCVNQSMLNPSSTLANLSMPAKASVPAVQKAKATANVNVRAEPGGNKVGRLSKGREMTVLDEKDGWAQIASGSGSKAVSGWVSAKYITKIESAPAAPSAGSSASGGLAALTGSMVSGANKASAGSEEFFKTGKVYKGYSKEYRPVNEMIHAGRADDALQLYKGKNKPEKKNKAETEKAVPEIDLVNKNLITLHNLQLGSLNLDAGNPKDSIANFKVSRKQLNMEDNESKVVSLGKTGMLAVAEFASGNEELQPYNPVGYEKVMMLNYNALAYLINGQNEAFNVARRAADWQDMERKAFAEKMAKARKELRAKNEDLEAGSSASKASNPFDLGKMNSSLNDEYSKFHKQANRVESAYVNPFSDYLIGMIMEYKSLQDRSKLDDARRHYKKASKLNRNSPLLAKAEKEMAARLKGKKGSKGTTLLHVVVADGAAPEKKVLTNIVPVPEAIVTLQLPIMEPVDNKVAKIKLFNKAGKTLATLDTIADIESMAMRHQKDSEPAIMFRAATTVARSFIEQKALSSMMGGLGNLVGSVRDQLSHPDTRSWSNLPSSIKAARLNVPRGTQEVMLVSYDRKGRKLATRKVRLNADGHNFVYARSINGSLKAHAARNLWING